MKYLIKSEKIEIPKGVTVTAKSRVITVKGPKGTVTKNFRHIKAEIDIKENSSSLSVGIFSNRLSNTSVLPLFIAACSMASPRAF